MSSDTFRRAALCTALGAVEQAMDGVARLTPTLGPDGPGIVADCQREILRNAALAAHRQAACARDAVMGLAERVHEAHAAHHPAGTTWLTCISETCEESRSLHAATLVVHPPLRRPPTDAVVALLAGSLLCRAGEVITPEVATECGRNAACWVLWLFDSFVHLLTDFLDDYEAGKLPEGLDDYANAARELLAEIGGGK